MQADFFAIIKKILYKFRIFVYDIDDDVERKGKKMNTIFYNGIIYTQDQAYPVCSALAVNRGVIAALGSDEEILALAGPDTEKINLDGAFVTPGFVDSHLHYMYYAQEKSCIDLSSVRCFEEAAALYRGKIAEAGRTGSWVMGVAFNQEDWEEKRIPTRERLDEISTDIPLLMRRVCHHITVCNSKALELCGLLDRCPDGIVREMEQNFISDAMPLPGVSDLKKLILCAADDLAEKGITEIQTDDFAILPGDCGETVMRAYRELAEEGLLPMRVYQQCSLGTAENLEAFLSRGHRTGDSYGNYRIGPLKIIADGSLGAHTAALAEPYRNDSSTRGILNYSDEEMEKLVRMGHEAGMQIAIHCIGDRALQQSLDALRKAQLSFTRADTRHGIVHCQIMTEKQQDQFQKLNLLAYIQPTFIRTDMHMVESCVGKALAASSYNWRRFEELGVHQNGGSDCPVDTFDVLTGLQHAVTRRDGAFGKVWYPEHALTVEEALRCYTWEGAYASFAEQVRGSLTVGKCADLTVLDQDITKVPADRIAEARVLMTMTGGRFTYGNQNTGK